jgi:hypothetical protein
VGFFEIQIFGGFLTDFLQIEFSVKNPPLDPEKLQFFPIQKTRPQIDLRKKKNSQ